jgi:hypothetical protein
MAVEKAAVLLLGNFGLPCAEFKRTDAKSRR